MGVEKILKGRITVSEGSGSGVPLSPTAVGDGTIPGMIASRSTSQSSGSSSSFWDALSSELGLYRNPGTGSPVVGSGSNAQTVSELLGYSPKPNPRNVPENIPTSKTRNPISNPKPSGSTVTVTIEDEVANLVRKARSTAPVASPTLIAAIDNGSKNGETLSLFMASVISKIGILTNAVSTGLNDVAAAVAVSSANHQFLFNSGSSMVTRLQGIEDKIDRSVTQLTNIAGKNSVINVAPSSPVLNISPTPITVNNSIDFDPIKTPLEDIAQSHKAYLEPSNVQINGQTVQASAAGLASMANISHIETNILKKEALSYEAEPKSLTLVSGEPAVEISPREAKALSAAQNMKHKSDINNEKFEDDDFDLKSLIMPMLSFKGVTSELDAIHGLFDTGLSTNPFNMDFNIFASYSDTKETI